MNLRKESCQPLKKRHNRNNEDTQPCGGTTSHSEQLAFGARLFLMSGFIPLDGIVNFAAMNRNFLRRFDAEANLISPNFNDDNRDVVVDDDAFVLLA